MSLKDGILDPEGQAVASALGRMGFDEVKDVRIGKVIEIELEDGIADAEVRVKQMCEQILSNPVIEKFHIQTEQS